MKVSVEWLSDYVALPSVDELAKKLTFAGLEIEAIERPPAGVLAGKILESVKHPQADKLSVTKVDFGRGPTQIVCGAKNYQVGDIVPVATVGTKLPNGTEIKEAELRGVKSSGMLCSARELGLSQDHEGLMILPPETKIGSTIDRVTFEVNVTPNRGDALSHVGIAREIAALTGKALKSPAKPVVEGGGDAAAKISVKIEDPSRCLRYAARVIEGVKVKPSPRWLQERLEACGVRAINNLVDVTNYVMLEHGQPLHAFDLDKLTGAQIVVRLPKAGEKLKTLDGKERTLEPEDLLICDREKPLALAGVMGGATSEVTDATTRVLLECASFAPAAVRRTSKRHALHTESSHRFERGTDIVAVPQVADRAAQLIAELGGGTVLKGLVDVYPKPVQPRRVKLEEKRLAALLGVEVPAEEAQHILEALGFKRGLEAYEVPQWRPDVSREEDLIEEVARIRGYDTIPLKLPGGLGALAPEAPAVTVERRVRVALAGEGVDEVVNYSFVAPAELAAFGAEKGAIALSNPLSAEQSVMRTTLYASLVPNVVRSVRHQASGLRFYEWGRSYRPDPEGGKGARPVANETVEVAGVLWGLRDRARTWTNKDAVVDFYDAKAAVEAVLSALHIEASWANFDSPWYHPRASAMVSAGGVVLGTVGELHPRAARALDAPAGVYLFQLEVEKLIAASRLVPKAQGLSAYPSVRRDIALVVKAELQQAELRRLILDIGKPLLVDAQVFDVYTGTQIAEGLKNVAFALEYRSPERTLKDDEVKQAHDRIVAEVQKQLGGALRA
ncbi:MAG: phenylalanine--tRNA ligase subunit beta [Myxococcaceae bacterium]|nr:phenylalanine--tRNA ligase subunit beta [Myxococcaceae bacterium]